MSTTGKKVLFGGSVGAGDDVAVVTGTRVGSVVIVGVASVVGVRLGGMLVVGVGGVMVAPQVTVTVGVAVCSTGVSVDVIVGVRGVLVGEGVVVDKASQGMTRKRMPRSQPVGKSVASVHEQSAPVVLNQDRL